MVYYVHWTIKNGGIWVLPSRLPLNAQEATEHRASSPPQSSHQQFQNDVVARPGTLASPSNVCAFLMERHIIWVGSVGQAEVVMRLAQPCQCFCPPTSLWVERRGAKVAKIVQSPPAAVARVDVAGGATRPQPTWSPWKRIAQSVLT